MAKRQTLSEISAIDWARLAAFIDGEGAIGIGIHLDKRNFSQRTYLRVTIGNTSPKLGEWLLSRFGGCVWKDDGPARKNRKWSPLYRWQVTQHKAQLILEGCKPYFVIKNEEAEVALAHQKLCKWPGAPGHSEETNRKRLELRDQLSMLKTPSRRLKHLQTAEATTVTSGGIN